MVVFLFPNRTSLRARKANIIKDTLLNVESQIPSKWDVIPLHTSDRATFKYCRRQWAWSSPSRSNLIPRTAVHGVRIPLWFGTGIHKTLEKFYDPRLQEDPVVVWLAWFDLQWNGGEVTKDQVAEFVDREPTKTPNGTYAVMGLRDVMPFPDEEQFAELRELGAGMMKFYKDYAQRNDDFRVIAVEHDFSVPVLDSDGKPLYMHDNREMPEGWEPNLEAENFYGSLMYRVGKAGPVMKQVHARGRMDKIIQENDDGRYGILDHKTTSRLDDDYFRHLELDEQCTTYLWAGEREAQMYDLEYSDLDFITYEGIYKGFPKPPTILKSGMPSINRNEESTTAEMFEACIKERGLDVVYQNDVKLQAYYQWLLERGEKRFIDRTPTWRNKIQRRNAGIRIYYEAIDMLSDPRLYPSPRKEYGCLNCIFRGPCIAVEDGSDYKSMIENGYVQNWDR